MSDVIRHEFDDGKYTVIFDTTKNPSLYALRHGEPWPGRDLVGDNMVMSMLFEVDDLKAQRDVLVAALLELAQCDGSDRNVSSAEVLARRIRVLAAATLLKAGAV